MPEIRTVVNTSRRDFHMLLFDIKYISKYPTRERAHLLCVLKPQLLDETAKRPHAKHKSAFSLAVMMRNQESVMHFLYSLTLAFDFWQLQNMYVS